MLALFWLVFGLGLAALVLAAGVSLRARRREVFGDSATVVDDAVVRQIIEQGEVFIDDEPLDLAEIDDEEERFWSESWDEPGSEW